MSTTTSTLENAAKPHLRPATVIGYGAGDAGCNIAFQMTGLFLLVYYTNVAGIRPSDAGTLFLVVKVWDAFADVFAGRMVDRTMTRWGKFRPFILWYSLPLLASNLLVFSMPEFDSYGYKLLWAYLTYALLGLLYSMVNIPYGSLAGAMSQNPVDRSRLASARMVGSGTTILLLAVILAPRIKTAANLHQTFLIVALIFLVVGMAMFMTTFLTSRETVYREVERVSLRETFSTLRRNGPLMRLCLSSFFYLTGQNIVSALAIYLANDVLARYVSGTAGWLAAVVTIITTGAVIYVGPFGPSVTRRLGKKRGFMTAAVISIVGGLLFAFSHNLGVALLALFLIGLGMALLNTMTWALEADTVEYGEYQTGIRTEGATYAAFSFTRKVGQAVGAAIASYALAFVGFRASTAGHQVTQTTETLNGMQAAAAFLPAAFFLVALLIMATYPLTEEKFKEIVRGIVANRAARHAALHGEDPSQAPR
ncbi:glycoside-pentoside-hexuronide (GPH):cation symporter [Georgenia sp. SYP-B2076]|uniref:glycoside-pentoside-hexuronide (GPH):cation symporter n=1 Tax=Georgenia sp. SYP-B2076 TaxID=2495881 RepID=UPI000F8EBED7|nr:glycoside-pentoside-hexuronide (GPH):cation symporter [Georgenia sp. SYP-B2076]